MTKISYTNTFSGPPLVVEINMQVRSMGPISEVDMVGTCIFGYLPNAISLLWLYIQWNNCCSHNALVIQDKYVAQKSLK